MYPSYTNLVPATQVHVGMYALLQEQPCRITDVTRSPLGKHGMPKIHLSGIDLFDDTQRDNIVRPHDYVKVPLVRQEEYLVIAINEGQLTLIATDWSVRNDIFVTGDLKDQIQTRVQNNTKTVVIVLCAMGRGRVLHIKAF